MVKNLFPFDTLTFNLVHSPEEILMFIYEKAPFPSCHASTVVELGNGDLLAAWFGGADEGAKDVKIYSSRFHDGKWGSIDLLAEEPGQPTWNPVLFVDATKALWLWYKAGPKPDNWSAYYRQSNDDGKTWSKTVQYPAGLLGPIRAKPILLADGTILAGSSVESYKAWTSYIERSKDNGKTWTRSNPIYVLGGKFGLIQPTLFEGKNGKIIALMRSRDTGRVCRSESKDGGITFSLATTTELPNPSAGIDCVKLKNGDVILIYNHTPVLRSPLNLARTKDDGLTWEKIETLEANAGEFSYPAMILSSKGTLEMTYTWNRNHIKHVSLEVEKLK
jgi:predicted neuraminidase